MNELKNGACSHAVIINGRTDMSVSGVTDVISFDEQTVIAETVMGQLTVKGEGLKVNSFAVETGSLLVEGTIIAVAYTGNIGKKGFMGRLFG